MLQTKTKTIGDHEYHVTQLGAKRGREVLTRLVKRIGPVLGALVEGGDARSVLDASGGSIARALQELSLVLADDDLEYLCKTFGTVTQVDLGGGKLVPLDLERQELHFAGAYDAMMRWILFALEVNFAGFFGALASVGASPRAPVVTGT